MLVTSQKEKEKSWLWKYTILFGVFAMLVYSLNIISGRSFVYTTESGVGDGLVQHYNSLMYYGEWLRTIFHNIFVEHRLEIPMWDFSIGLGGDILTTLSFYVLGDPFSFLSVFVPAEYTEILYNILVIARLYVAGVAFFVYCRYHKYQENNILVGCMIYVFSFYSIVVSVLHPYYLNPLIYLPLILLGIDKILNDEKPIVFILSCWIAAISNFYFFYMLSIIMVIYAVIRYLTKYGKKIQLRHLLKKIGICVFGYIWGVMLAAPVFIPAAMSILSSDRVGTNAYVPLLYEPIYYIKLVIAFVNASADYYSAFGYTVVGLCAVLLLLFRTKFKEKVSLKIAFVIGCIFLCLPFFGHVLNGFSYVVNRWVWAYCFVVALIVIEMMPMLVSLKWRSYVGMAVMVVAFAACTFYFRGAGNSEKLNSAAIALSVMCMLLAGLLLIGKFMQQYRMNKGELDGIPQNGISTDVAYYVLMGIIAVNIFFNMYGFYSENSGGDILNHGINGEAYELYMNSLVEVMSDVEDADVVRYDTGKINERELMVNSAMQHDVNGTAFYYSTTNDSVEQYIQDMNLDISALHKFFDMDSRAWIDAALGVKYFLIEDTAEARAYLPYGYSELVKEEDGYALYASEYALPLVYTFDGYISENDYESMTSVQKQQTVLQGMVLSEEGCADAQILNFPEAEVELKEYDSPYEIVYGEGISVEEGKIIVSEKNAVLTIRTEQVQGCERYLYWSGLSYSGTNKTSITVSGTNFSNSLEIAAPRDTFYMGERNVLLNLGYTGISEQEYTVCFHNAGVYETGNIEIVNLPMNEFGATIDKLKQAEINYEITNNNICIDISTDKDKLVYIAAPYSSGWHAEIDGEEVAVYRANGLGMGIAVTAGEHQIILKYTTPYFKVSMWIAGIALLGIVGFVFYGLKKNKANA